MLSKKVRTSIDGFNPIKNMHNITLKRYKTTLADGRDGVFEKNLTNIIIYRMEFRVGIVLRVVYK